MTEQRPLSVGVVGLGMAGNAMVLSMAAHPLVRVVAAADTNAALLDRYVEDTGARPYPSIEALCADPRVEAVYIATPHQFHRQHAVTAIQAGKHVIMEKPLALSLEDCDAVIQAVEASPVTLIIGHTESYAPAIRTMRQIIASGELGPLSMVNSWHYNDFLYRPRRPEELDTTRGGGILFNQTPHQVDVVRLLGGGLLRSVRAHTGILDPARPTEGSLLAYLEFESGAAASIVYSGYDFFDTRELHTWLPPERQKAPERYGQTRRSLKALGGQAAEMEQRVARYAYSGRAAPQSMDQPHFGITVASCERGDLRPWANGVMLYDESGRREVPVPEGRGLPARGEVLDELYDAVVLGRPPLHTARWAKATIEVSLAILESAGTRREVPLHFQVPTPPGV